MTTSKEVFASRKSGQIDEAYQMALVLMAKSEPDDWDRRAYGWCLIDLVKRHAQDRDRPETADYIVRLSNFEVPAGDDLLEKQRKYALSISQGDRRAVRTARSLGKEGKHDQAVRAFAEILQQGSLEPEDLTAYGWELYKASRDIVSQAAESSFPPAAVAVAKRHLNSYLNLRLEAPSLLHSCILQQAQRIAAADHLRLIAFVRIWGLENLRPDDFDRFVPEDGKTRSSLAEKVVQQSSRDAVSSGRSDELRYILPFVETMMERFPDNNWLKLNRVKLLRALDRTDEARRLATEFARSKASEYWVWDLLGDLAAEESLRLSCYAKALACSQDDNFVSGVRIKLADLLANTHPGQAKAEVERVIDHKRRAGHRIPAEAQRLSEAGWFAAVNAAPLDKSFYARLAPPAEELLFAHLPWTDATLGDRFILEAKEGQKSRTRRRLYMKSNPFPLEISVPDTHPQLKGKAIGTAIRVQAELSCSEPGRAIVHRIAFRDQGAAYDVFAEKVGVIDHINTEKSLLHFIIDKDIEGTCALSDFPELPEPGMVVTVQMAHYYSRQGRRFRALSIRPSAQLPSPHICRRFHEVVTIPDRFGFTASDIFIPPHLVDENEIKDGDRIEGIAVLSYNKKRKEWGWKAVSVNSLTN
ncbi:DUF7017 domain-containing protein [Phyllobacterium endophyticum]|uniref:DUF7017 domain-containing protein n=1 Tax=Phyllobacterium endophyticum TaxID=1149773 RepID=UPI0011CC652D|nr:hypothetical protein [Phyllobacterium endophyticum]TXR47499.1 hypothetical protein FVA77_19405 [Phyllobacterium endophyticum]